MNSPSPFSNNADSPFYNTYQPQLPGLQSQQPPLPGLEEAVQVARQVASRQTVGQVSTEDLYSDVDRALILLEGGDVESAKRLLEDIRNDIYRSL